MRSYTRREMKGAHLIAKKEHPAFLKIISQPRQKLPGLPCILFLQLQELLSKIKRKEPTKMACRKAYQMKNIGSSISDPNVETYVSRLLFGVDSAYEATSLLQNNIDLFEWVLRNKVYPNFVGRYILGESCLTKEEILFLHEKGCPIAPIFCHDGKKSTDAEGERCAAHAIEAARALGIRGETALYLELSDGEGVTRDFLRGVAKEMLIAGYTPAFRANTDAAYGFDREFGRGTQSDPEVFRKCLIWAMAPTLAEYDRMTTSHLIHPDNWTPFAPSAITRNEIAIWQYGKECHPIEDEQGRTTTFNLSLVRNEDIIIKKMF